MSTGFAIGKMDQILKTGIMTRSQTLKKGFADM